MVGVRDRTESPRQQETEELLQSNVKNSLSFSADKPQTARVHTHLPSSFLSRELPCQSPHPSAAQEPLSVLAAACLGCPPACHQPLSNSMEGTQASRYKTKPPHSQTSPPAAPPALIHRDIVTELTVCPPPPLHGARHWTSDYADSSPLTSHVPAPPFAPSWGCPLPLFSLQMAPSHG